MARIRTLKPEFFTNTQLGRLSPLHRLLFEGMWCHADREGRLKDNPDHLKIVILPFDACDPNELLHDLHAANLIIRYRVKGESYIAIPTFLQHQRPHFKESASIIPAHGKHQPRMVPAPTQDGASPLVLGTCKTLVLGTEIETSKGTVTADTPTSPPDQLMHFWNDTMKGKLPTITALSRPRRQACLARLTERPLAEWPTVFQRMTVSEFLLGESKGRDGQRPFKATFDWIIQNGTNHLKVMEGNYDNHAPARDAWRYADPTPTPTITLEESRRGH